MAAWRYENSLLVLKKYFTCSQHSLVKYFSTLEEKFRTSARPCNILYIHHIKLRHKRSRQHNNTDRRINITTFFNLPDIFRRYIRHLQCYIF